MNFGGVGEILSALETCRADKDSQPADAHRETLAALEGQLAAAMPMETLDLMNLAGQLNDNKLSAETRTKIACNLARMAPMLAARHARVLAFCEALENGFEASQSAQAGAVACLNKATEMMSVAQAALKADSGNNSGVSYVLDAVASEIIATHALLEISATYLHRPRALLHDLTAEEHAETALFCEAIGSTAH